LLCGRVDLHRDRLVLAVGERKCVCLGFSNCGKFLRTHLVPNVRAELVCVCIGFSDCGESHRAHHGLDVLSVIL
jgi:hypothetical protein